MKRRITKRPTIKKQTKGRRKNPSELDIRAELKVEIKPLSTSKSRVVVYYKGTPLLDREMSNSEAKLLASKHGKESLARNFAPVLNSPRRNPTKPPKEPKEEKVGAAVSIGEIKLDPRAAYRLGYRKGLLDGLDKCGIGDFFERQALRTQLAKAMDQSLDELHERITAPAQIGRFPQIK